MTGHPHTVALRRARRACSLSPGPEGAARGRRVVLIRASLCRGLWCNLRLFPDGTEARNSQPPSPSGPDGALAQEGLLPAVSPPALPLQGVQGGVLVRWGH